LDWLPQTKVDASREGISQHTGQVVNASGCPITDEKELDELRDTLNMLAGTSTNSSDVQDYCVNRDQDPEVWGTL
jgi:hypothetical protein